MAYIIEIDDNGLIILTLPDDSIVESRDINEIFQIIRTNMTKEGKETSLSKLFDL